VPRLSGLLSSLVVVLVTGGLAVLGAPAIGEVADPPAVPSISWEKCPKDQGLPRRAQCAAVPVPLDYDEPAGRTVDLDLLRMRATDRDARIGTLFVNPGGPGASSRFFAAHVGELVPSGVSRRFDVVGIDPRGVGPSAYALCRNPDRHPPYPDRAFPTTDREVRQRLAFDRWERQGCRDGARPIVEHATTADDARDMDLVRQAVGDAQLTYYGISYGTQLGTTYAAMFPDHVRAMVVDGVLDPVQWSTGREGETDQPFSDRVGSDDGAWESLTQAFTECDRVGAKRCAIAGHARSVWRSVAHRLQRHPFQGMHYSDLVSFALGSLYDASAIRGFLGSLGELHARIVEGDRSARPPVARIRADAGRGLPGPYAPTGAVGTTAIAPVPTSYGAFADPFAVVACADTDNPDDPHAWVGAARRADRTSHGFGSAWTWASSVCAGWPARTQEDRFTGPYDVTPSAPVLVVGNTHDPATPIAGARAVHQLLGGSRLLVLDGFGHGALGTGRCIRQAYGAYLVGLELPDEGAVCTPDRELFPRR
jgi:pimeloyl-ACP methyl ester carboxylesterase